MPSAIFIFDSSQPENIRALADLKFYKKTMKVADAMQDADDPNRLVISFASPPPPSRALALEKSPAKKSAKKKG